MYVIGQSYQKFVSDSYPHCDRLLPAGILLVLSWTLPGAAFITSLWILPYNPSIALPVLVLTSVFVAFIWRRTNRLSMESTFRYELLVTANEVILYTYDLVDREETVHSVAISKVSIAEYFSAGDITTLTLIARGHHLEIPLWTFGSKQRAILRTLRDAGIAIVTLQEQPVSMAA
jgi:hypothetical protein